MSAKSDESISLKKISFLGGMCLTIASGCSAFAAQEIYSEFIGNSTYCVEAIDGQVNVYETLGAVRESKDAEGNECYMFTIGNDVYVTYKSNSTVIDTNKEAEELITKYSDNGFEINWISEQKNKEKKLVL